MLLIITGNIGAGKSTVCREAADGLISGGCSCGGIITTKLPDGGILIEDVATGRSERLAFPASVETEVRLGPFNFVPQGIEFGMGAVKRGKDLPCMFIDEIGPLELSGRGFTNVLPLLREKSDNVRLVVIRKPLLDAFSALMPPPDLVFETTADNRDSLPGDIVKAVLSR